MNKTQPTILKKWLYGKFSDTKLRYIDLSSTLVFTSKYALGGCHYKPNYKII